jgi:holo-[acyl-carrier-protein] synthase
MILGIGTDIVAVARLRAVLARRGDHFARRVLHAGEWLGYAGAADPARLLARRFAAKEAVAKALGTGFREGVGPSQIEVVHNAKGGPGAQLHGAAAVELHTGAYADAIAPAERARELARLVAAAAQAAEAGLAVHAGHGLNYVNAAPVAAIAPIVELNIGHAIVARAVLSGMHEAVREMKRLMVEARRA